jgi:hypothetical protein
MSRTIKLIELQGKPSPAGFILFLNALLFYYQLLCICMAGTIIPQI